MCGEFVAFCDILINLKWEGVEDGIKLLDETLDEEKKTDADFTR
ncbi:hypothetical protein [Marivirga lumbricoides]